MRRALAVLLCALAVGGLGRVALTEVVGRAETRASDALPLYLSAGAVAAGLDPTQERSLARVYDDRGLSVGAATFSTLYPATTGALLRPLSALPWDAFTTVWRSILLFSVVAIGLAAAALAPGDRWTRAGWGGAVAAALAWHPVTAECVRLGQINLLLGGLCALAMAATRLSAGASWGGGLAPRNAPLATMGPATARDPDAIGATPPETPGSDGTRGAASGGGALRGGPAPPPPEPHRYALPFALAAGALLALGGALKLVPAALLLPLWAARRWTPTLGAAAVGLASLGLALTVTPLAQLVVAILGTLRFQASIDPDWLVGQDPAPGWMRLFGWARHTPLQWISLGAAAIVPFLRPSPRTAVAAMALLLAWLGADAAGFHVLYVPLAYPVFAALAGRVGMFAVLVASFYALAWGPDTLSAEPRMVLFGFCAWGAAAATLLRAAAEVRPSAIEADPEVKQAGLAMSGVVSGVLIVSALPGDGPVAPPLPEGTSVPEGPGFIHPNDRVPGEVRALGGGLDRPASTLAKPGTIRHLQLYMRSAPVAWRALAERYPARAALFEARARAAPGGDLRDHSGRAVAAWLTEETEVVDRLRAEGLDLGELPDTLARALGSGLAEPGLEERIPHDR